MAALSDSDLARIKSIFTEFDSDQDGRLSFTQYVQAFALIQELHPAFANLTDDEIETGFRRCSRPEGLSTNGLHAILRHWIELGARTAKPSWSEPIETELAPVPHSVSSSMLPPPAADQNLPRSDSHSSNNSRQSSAHVMPASVLRSGSQSSAVAAPVLRSDSRSSARPPALSASAAATVPSPIPDEVVSRTNSYTSVESKTRPSSRLSGQGKETTGRKSMRRAAADKASATLTRVGKWFGVVDADEGQGMIEMRDAFVGRKAGTAKSTASDNDFENDADTSGDFIKTVPMGFATVDSTKFGFADDSTPTTPVDPAPAKRLITNYDEALKIYRAFVIKEKAEARKQLIASGTTSNPAAATPAPGATGSNALRSEAPAPRRQRAKDKTAVRAQLASLTVYRPYFTYILTFVQLALIVAMCAHSFAIDQFGRIDLKERTETCSATDCPSLLGGSLDSSATRVIKSNIWIGPKSEYLIRFAGKYTPCMREDQGIQAKLATERAVQCGISPNFCEGGRGSDTGFGYSCCQVGTQRGMTNNETCQDLLGVWDSVTNRLCPESADVVLRPCCIGSTSTCELLTKDYCDYKGGLWHADSQLCSEVACLSATCETFAGGKLKASSTATNYVQNPNQWYRFIVPLFTHAGIVHFVLCMLVQWTIGCQIERTAGFIRTTLIYFCSGIGGYVVSGIFDPYQVTVGSDPAIFGLLAVLVVELFQSWQIVPNPKTELVKLIIVVAIALVIGTFPFIDNFGHIGGFLFGIVSAILFLPFITFGKWDARRKRLLLYISFPLLVVFFIVVFVVFYHVQNTQFCSWCHHLNCIEYSPDIKCRETEI